MHAAAWVQAIGSVLAIFVAVAIPAWQRHTSCSDRKNEQFLQARSLLYGISVELLEIEAAHQHAEKVFAEAREKESGSGSAVRDFLATTNIAVPPMLIAGMPQYYLLGEPAGLTLPQLVATTLQYERKPLQIINGIGPNLTRTSFTDPARLLQNHLISIGTLLQQANSELARFR